MESTGVIGFADIEFASLTDVGVKRSHNQDAHAIMAANDEEQWRARGHVFLVADGMGAHAVGELASKLAADSIPHIYSKHSQEGPGASLRKAFIEANISIHTRGQQNREFQGMGTTATALVIRPEGAWVGHVGDSRVYRIRGNFIEQLSFDHSLVWELAKRHQKQPEELTGVPSNVIIRSLGPEPLVQVDIEGPHPVLPGDCFLLCSDGLSGPVTDREIGAVVGNLAPEEACRFLIHLANLQGGPDNITAVVVHVAGVSNPGMGNNPGVRRPSLAGRLFHHFPWPIIPLFIGISLALVAIFLTYREMPGELQIFGLAAFSLIVGLFGLMFQNVREGRGAKKKGANLPLQVYRRFPCTVDKVMVDKLAHGVVNLEDRLAEKNWHSNTQASRRHADQGKRLLQEGELAGAFREQCRALLVLMEALDAQRNKEETFKPLWDRAPVG